jgi:hypothetical protein
MERDEFERLLRERRVLPDAYSLSGPACDDCYVLEHVPGGWTAYYYSERGTRHEEQQFKTEQAAFDYLWSLMRGDQGIVQRSDSDSA